MKHLVNHSHSICMEKKPAIKQLADVFEKVQSSVLGTMEVEYKNTYKYLVFLKKEKMVSLKN